MHIGELEVEMRPRLFDRRPPADQDEVQAILNTQRITFPQPMREPAIDLQHDFTVDLKMMSCLTEQSR